MFTRSLSLLRGIPMFYLLRYRVASEWVELFMVSRVDALALASVIRVNWRCPVQVWFLSGDDCIALEGVHYGEVQEN